MHSSKRTPVIILNGFLGSGKTTLFRSFLAQARKKDIAICAVVNDMSELDVDGALLENTDIVEDDSSILESIHNCNLSSQNGLKKLDESIDRLLSKHEPSLLIIETSGSSHPMPLIQYFNRQKDLKLTGVFALVDSLMLAHDYEYGKSLIPTLQANLQAGKRDTVNLLVEQILFCSHLFITKSDRIDESKLPQIAAFMEQINPNASLHALVYGKLEIESLFDLPEYNYYQIQKLVKELKPVLAKERLEEKPYNLATRVIKDDRPFHPQRLWDVCHQYLDQRIYRSKGFFWLATRDQYSMLWNQAAGGINLEILGSWRAGILADENNGLTDVEVKHLEQLLAEDKRRFGDRHCDLTVIGDKSQVDRFTDALKDCFLSEEEIEQWQNGFEFSDPWPRNIVRLK